MKTGMRLAYAASIAFGVMPSLVLAWNSLTYQQALKLCSNGYQQACAVAIQYQLNARQQIPGGANSGIGGSPADAWVSPQELQRGGIRGSRPGVFSTYDFVR
jgi:hypothetical protein